MLKLIYYLIGFVILFIIFSYIIGIVSYQPKYGEKKIIKNSQKYKPTKLLVVAHPDDDVCWGYRYLIDKPYRWKVICMTGASNQTRVNEFKKVMKKIGVLNYEIWDHNESIFANKVHQDCVNDIIKDILKQKYTYILTHNFYGEYGNIQHISVHNIMDKLKKQYNFPINYFRIRGYKYSKTKNDLLWNYYKSQRHYVILLNLIHPFY
uniref:N-acetylglucosaminylphosphatidylinositol deacetylase n=1 Tax=Mimivirus LCMiAC02 TaxID=2506609 RepID=A0A481Z3X3_9VIRU|nr:MAG: uncharacterized protein LCMiAC02_01990 [Mimivirus LCMiAC02]